MPPVRKAAILLVLIAAAFAAACGDDGDDTASPTASATPATAATNAPSPTTVPSVSPTPTKAQLLGSNPRFVIYVVSQGDTLLKIADAFDAVPGREPTLAGELRRQNDLPSDTIQPGQELAVPMRIPGTLSFFADNSIEEAIGVGAAGGKLVLLQPSLEARSGFLGRLVLARVQLADGTPATEGFGYVMTYSLTDRPLMKAGEIDEQARIVTAAFIVGGGSLVRLVRESGAKDIATFTRDGVDYAVGVLASSGVPPAAELAKMLKTALER